MVDWEAESPDHQQYRRIVDQFKGFYIDWLANLQKDAYAQGQVIEPEIIATAFRELYEYYTILGSKNAKVTDEDIDNFFKEQE